MTQTQKNNIIRLAIDNRMSFTEIVQRLMDINNSRSAMDVITGKQFTRLAGTSTLVQSQATGGMAGVFASEPVPPDV